jgi:hypothetical protein
LSFLYRYNRLHQRITTTAINDAEKIRKYYSIFINTMADVIRDFNETIIKNTGDNLLYYFPILNG